MDVLAVSLQAVLTSSHREVLMTNEQLAEQLRALARNHEAHNLSAVQRAGLMRCADALCLLTPAEPTGFWVCANCKGDNFPPDMACVHCGENRYAAQSALVASSAEPRAPIPVEPRAFRGNGPNCLGCGKTLPEHLTNYNFCPGLPQDDKQERTMQALADQAQALDMGYGETSSPPEITEPSTVSSEQVSRICEAYESGYGRGLSQRDLAQPYATGSAGARAYYEGWLRGCKAASTQNSSPSVAGGNYPTAPSREGAGPTAGGGDREPREPDARFNGLLTEFGVAQSRWARGEGTREEAAAAREAVYQHMRITLNRRAQP